MDSYLEDKQRKCQELSPAILLAFEHPYDVEQG